MGIYTGGGMLGTATVMGLGALPDNGFIDLVSDTPIGETVIESLGGNGELFDNLLFGAAGPDLPPPPAVPALQSTGSLLPVCYCWRVEIKPAVKTSNQ